MEGSDRGDFVCVCVLSDSGWVCVWLAGGCVGVTKRDKARGSDEIIMRVSVLCAYTASACVGRDVRARACAGSWSGRQGEMLSVYRESEGPSRLLLHFESRTHADMNVIGGN